MSWLVDNATAIYILLAIIAAGLVVAWRFNQQLKYLFYAAGVLVFLALTWLAVKNLPSDRKQLEDNVHAMANAVVGGKVDELFKHISKDFRWKGIDRDLMYAGVKKSIEAHKITYVNISSFRVEELSRAKGFAKTSFLVSATAGGDIWFRAEADFGLEGEQWKLKTMRFYRPVGGQDQEMDLPGIR